MDRRDRLGLRRPRSSSLDAGLDEAQLSGHEATVGRRAGTIAGVKTRKLCICHAEVGHRSITPGHLGLLSESLGGKLIRWDPKTETIVGDADADKKLKSVNFRKPWMLQPIA